MADNKTKRFWPAFWHAVTYSLPFLLLQPSLAAFSVILVTHFLIDRYKLARHVVWAKNALLRPWPLRPPFLTAHGRGMSHEELVEWITEARVYEEEKARYRWSNCNVTGYPNDSPPWLSVWLLIAADNTLHLLLNFLALKFL